MVKDSLSLIVISSFCPSLNWWKQAGEGQDLLTKSQRGVCVYAYVYVCVC